MSWLVRYHGSMERVQKIIAQAGIASRRKSEELIEMGRVHVNGERAVLGTKASATDSVTVDGIEVPRIREHSTFMINKPKGIISTMSDEKGRKTVMAFAPPVPGLHPVGRLDGASEGLLILTTDGDLTMHVTHPSNNLDKVYRVWTNPAHVNPEHLEQLVKGVHMYDGFARAIAAKPLPNGALITVKEGRHHIVRRLLKAVGYKVKRLQRTEIAKLKLGLLKTGEYRELNEDDFKKLGYTGPGEK